MTTIVVPECDKGFDMLSTINDDLHTLTHIETVYEIDNNYNYYKQGYHKLNTSLHIMNDITTCDINTGIYKTNLINAINDNLLGNHNYIEAGYESMFETGADILINIWNFIKNLIKKLITVIYNLYKKFIKFLSSFVKNEKKQKKEINKLIKEVNKTKDNIKDKMHNNISDSDNGAGGISGKSDTGNSVIDKKALEISEKVQNNISGDQSLVNESPKVKNKFKELAKDFSVFTHLHTYYGKHVINEYLTLLENSNMYVNNIHLNYSKITGRILGNKKHNEQSSLVVLTELLCKISKESDIPDKELKKLYNNVIDNIKELVDLSKYTLTYIGKMNKLMNSNEYFKYFTEQIIKDNNYPEDTLVLITCLKPNSVDYVRLSKSKTILANDRQSIEDRVLVLEELLQVSSKQAVGSKIVNYLDDNLVPINLPNVITSISRVIEGYNYICDLLYLERYTYTVKPHFLEEDFFINRSTYNLDDILVRLTRMFKIVDAGETVRDDIKDIILSIKDNSTLTDVVNDIDKCIPDDKRSDKFLSNALINLNKIINNFNNLEVTINKISIDTLNKNQNFLDRIIAMERTITSTNSVFIMDEIKS